MPLFQVAIIQKPTVREAEKGVDEKLILPPTAVIAKNPKSAVAAAMNQIETKLPCNTSMIKVIVHQFVDWNRSEDSGEDED